MPSNVNNNIPESRLSNGLFNLTSPQNPNILYRKQTGGFSCDLVDRAVMMALINDP